MPLAKPGPLAIIIYLFLAATAILMLSIFSQIDNWRRDLTENFAQLDPSSDDPELRPLRLSASDSEIVDRLEAWVDSAPRWNWEGVERQDELTVVRLTRRTALFRFVDDITVTIRPRGEQSELHAESQSRVGKGDLGQNPRNLKEMVRAMSGTGM